MSDLELSQLAESTAKIAASPQMGLNLESALEIMGKLDKFMTYLDKWNVKVPLIRLLAQNSGIAQDLIDKPLIRESADPNAIIPRSETHKKLFTQLQTLEEDELKKQLEIQIQKQEPAK